MVLRIIHWCNISCKDNLNPYSKFQAEAGDAKLCNYVKTSPEGGLVWRLSVTAARLYDAGGLPYLAHLWYEFTQELQYRWEHRIVVPGYVLKIYYIFNNKTDKTEKGCID